MQATPAFRAVKPVAALQLLLQPPNTGPGCSGTTQKQCMECLLEKCIPLLLLFLSLVGKAIPSVQTSSKPAVQVATLDTQNC